MITAQDLISDDDLAERGRWVGTVIRAALSSPSSRVAFFGRYARWNGLFGSGVATLSGKIGRMTSTFVDPNEPIHALADRSVLVASYIFDAARDEFNDHTTKHRDTHRCLAQATVKGVIAHEALQDPRFSSPTFVNGLFPSEAWLSALCTQVAQGYGHEQPDEALAVFEAMGYHLGSELLADQEFSVIDETLRNTQPDLAQALQNTTVHLGKAHHVAYAWISIHSGYGGGAEADHFEWATRGLRLALELTPEDQREAARAAMRVGFERFSAQHHRFFSQIEALGNCE